jgi:drug/metabolite transporter (DMT)-like permease
MIKLSGRRAGIAAALSSALFLGLAPVFGKAAISLGFSPLFVVAFRTSLAALLLLFIITLFKRQFLYIFPVGLIGCFMAGAINGIGSILYYTSLRHLSASVGQLLYSLYPFFVAIWLTLDNQPPSKLTMTRIGLATIAVIFLTYSEAFKADLTGVLLMLGASLLYALHLPINQRVLYEIPAPTVTLYTLISMSLVVVPAYLLFDRSFPPFQANWGPLLGLTFVTFASRLTLFLGVKHLGGLQTALLGLAELFVTLIASNFLLNEHLTLLQWIGVAILGISLLLVSNEKQDFDRVRPGGWLSWLSSPSRKMTWPFDS